METENATGGAAEFIAPELYDGPLSAAPEGINPGIEFPGNRTD